MATVLIVDDDPYIRELLDTVVSELGHTVLSAPDGEVALSLARTHLPDLIISDVMMPNLDGYGLVTALRADPRFTLTEVFLMSALFGLEYPSRPGFQATGFLKKPFALLEIECLLQRFAA